MRAWLDTPEMLAMPADLWPTGATSSVWLDFISQQRGDTVTRWRRVQFQCPAHQELLIVEPDERGWLRPTENPELSEFLRPDLTSCGFVDFAFPGGGPRWARAVAISDKEVRVHYIGPWKKPKD